MSKLAIKLPKIDSPNPDLVLLTQSRELAIILESRGISDPETISEIMDPLGTPGPNLQDYPPLASAVSRLLAAVDQGLSLAVYGDYDVDGITATTVLVEGLRRLGADVIYHIPNRFSEGYGMHPDRVRALAAGGTELVITCDCGISNYQEVALARSLGMEVIITDHHTPPANMDQLFAPDVPILNFQLLPPEHPCRLLPGVGTAYFLVRELLHQKGLKADDLLDLVALGIIADVVPLDGQNRVLLKHGFHRLTQAQRPGLAALFEVAGLTPGRVDEESLAFQIIPRLNAAGRLQEGGLGVELLLSTTHADAMPLALTLNELNQHRKELNRKITEQLQPVSGTPLVEYEPEWHQGVIGISAGSVCNSYQIPVALMTMSESGQIVGSARSVPGINIYQALSVCSEHLLKFGGHPGAAGFALDANKLEPFRRTLIRRLKIDLDGYVQKPLQAELELSPGQINLELVAGLRKIAPFGEGNPRPLCYCPRVQVRAVRNVTGGHILTLGQGRHSFTAGLWHMEDVPAEGSLIRMAFTVGEDFFRSESSVRVTIIEWWPESVTIEQEPDLHWMDCRNQEVKSVRAKYPEAAFFREGVSWLDFPGHTRNNLPVSGCLVLLTAPASKTLLGQVAALSQAEKIVLAFGQTKPLAIPELFRNLIGLVKYSLSYTGGVVPLTHMGAALALPEELVLEAIKQLASRRILDFQLRDGVLHLDQGPKQHFSTKTNVQALEEMIQEVNAYRRWLQIADIKEIQV